jgi:hypothetical protein
MDDDLAPCLNALAARLLQAQKQRSEAELTKHELLTFTLELTRWVEELAEIVTDLNSRGSAP